MRVFPQIKTIKTVVDNGLRPQCAIHGQYFLVCMVEQNLVGISAVMPVVFYRRLGTHMTHRRAVM